MSTEVQMLGPSAPRVRGAPRARAGEPMPARPAPVPAPRSGANEESNGV